jgi:4-hydroxy-2-oxoheptanedioate aldolase
MNVHSLAGFLGVVKQHFWPGGVMSANRVKQLYREGKPSFGTYVTFPTAAIIEVAALSGFDFVRLDPYHLHYNPETLENMVRAAYAHGVTPWARCRNDPWTIMMTLDAGIQAISIPNTGSAAEARAAVAAAFYPPKGEREMSRPLRMRGMTAPEYLEWAANEVIVSCQIEGLDGIDNYKEIVKVKGVDCIQTGRGDLSLALGVPGEEGHPKVLEAEERIVEAALAAGKQVSLLHSLTDEGLERMHYWMDQGVRILTVDSDYRVLMREYAAGLKKLRG